MIFPNRFPGHAQAAVIAEQVQARAAFMKSLSLPGRGGPPGYTAREQWAALARAYVLRIFYAFAHQACELGRLRTWTAKQVDDECREFLRLLASGVGIEFGELPVPHMLGNTGSILPEVWREFTKSEEWTKYQDELLQVAQLQADAAPESPTNAPGTANASTLEASPAKTISERLDEAVLHEDISHDEQASRIGIGRTTYFEVKAGRGGRKSRQKTELYLSRVLSTRSTSKPDSTGLNRTESGP